ncbi:hypothetical protein ACI65C_013355 [Semiaphis heraclei]
MSNYWSGLDNSDEDEFFGLEVIDGLDSDESLAVSSIEDSVYQCLDLSYRKYLEAKNELSTISAFDNDTSSNLSPDITIQQNEAIAVDIENTECSGTWPNDCSSITENDCSSVNIVEASDEENLVGNEKKGKKRHRNQLQWGRNISKNKKSSGLEHLNSVGKLIKERKTGPRCKCKLKCFDKICEEDRLGIIKSFNSISNKEKQDTYLCGLIKIKSVERKRPRTGVKNSKSYIGNFLIRIGMIEYNVCKKALCSMHGITLSRVNRLQLCVKSNNLSPKDKRGKHVKRTNIISDTILNQVSAHIKSFPARESHYSRESNSNVKYLPPELNLSIMHKLYLEKYEIDVYNKMQNDEETKPIVKYDFFCRFFADNFNIRFGYPRTDTCQTCDRLKNVIDVETNEESKMLLETEKQVHVSKAEFFYQDLKKYEKESKINNTTEVLCFDYQQNLPLPHVPAGDVFYKRQLWVYNFCIYSGKTGKSYFYMYDEAVAKKGKNEVISFLKHFFDTILDRQVTTIYLFSDNCSAQNKNHTLTQFLYTVVNTKMHGIKKIVHRYPEPGHSFLPCDRNFGQIEKQRRRQERVFLPVTYQNIVTKTSKKFKVINITQNLILNFADHFKPKFKTQKQLQLLTYRNMSYSEDGLRVSILSSIPIESQPFILEKPRTILTLPDPEFRLYHQPLPINSAKLKDVQDLVSKYVPPDCLYFYSSLTSHD